MQAGAEIRRCIHSTPAADIVGVEGADTGEHVARARPELADLWMRSPLRSQPTTTTSLQRLWEPLAGYR